MSAASCACPGSASAPTPRAWRRKACSSTSIPIPRAYGNFARLLGHYVRDEGLVTLPDAIRRLTSLPAHQSRHRPARRAAAGLFRGPRHLRSAHDRRPRDLCRAPGLRARHAPCLRQRRPGAARRRADRRDPGPRRPRPRLAPLPLIFTLLPFRGEFAGEQRPALFRSWWGHDRRANGAHSEAVGG